jgi:DNA polymerase-4
VPRTILHVDMNAFFVSAEVLRRPELEGRAVVVGGSGPRGVVAAASYEARRYGVHSAMPSTRAQRLCPHAVFLPGDHAYYGEVSARVMAIFRSYTPLVEPISLDEAFLDVTAARRLRGDGPTIAASIRGRVRSEEGLQCSVGVAPSKFLAKLASEAAKPRASFDRIDPGPGVIEVEPGAELAFLHPLPVAALWGVGPATLERLQRLGVSTVGDLAAIPLTTLQHRVGNHHGTHLHELAHARDPRPVVPEQALKSVSHEETFATDHHRVETLTPEVVRMADATAERMRRAGVTGRTVTLKVRFGSFRTITRSVTLSGPTDSARAIAGAARGLLDQIDPASGVRLVGVAVTNLDEGGTRQLGLFDDDATSRTAGRAARAASWDAAEQAVGEVRDRFGTDAVVPARLVDADGVRVKRRGDQQWGPDAAGADP